MIESKAVYCILQWHHYQSSQDIKEFLPNYAKVRQRLQHIQRQFEVWEHGDSGNASVILTNQWGSELLAGMSEEGWLLILSRNEHHSTHIVRGGVPDEGHITFYIPEWTDFKREDLITKEYAEQVIIKWLGDEMGWKEFIR